MLNNFQLAAIVKQGAGLGLRRIPMHQALQTTLATTWQTQLAAFLKDVQEIDFDPGYQPEEHERFALRYVPTPAWLGENTSTTVADLDPIRPDEGFIANIKGIAGFARDENGKELVLFQNFSRSHIIIPGAFLLFRGEIYETSERAGLRLDTKLVAVYRTANQMLLFGDFRIVNTFLPLADFYEELSEQQIRDVLKHDKLAPVNVDAIAVGASQWFRKRFAMLRDSGVLDEFTAGQIKSHAKGYGVTIEVKKGRIVFPGDRVSAKTLLQFLNEELFIGAITETRYQTNSKRKAD
jgi:hypothetical protein